VTYPALTEPTTPTKPDSCAIVSGGLDSTTLVYDMLSHGYTPHMLSFDYGQRHKKELSYAAMTAQKLGLRHDIIDLSSITYLISNSALTSGVRQARASGDTYGEIEVPEGHYAEDSMKATVVPNRNMIMLAIAGGVAVSNNYKTIGIGVHGGDHFIYPDCRPEFIFSVGQALLQGNEGFHNFHTEQANKEAQEMGFMQTTMPITSPYLDSTKADIAYRAYELGLPFEDTWSCYKGGQFHCGKCGTCVERLEAIDIAQNKWIDEGKEPSVYASGFDGTVYEDTEFWKTAKAN
jgi:7-cyano-7-deazaguanine synthase